MQKKICELVPGDLLEVIHADETVTLAKVVRVSDRKLLPAFFEHYAGRAARTVDLEDVATGEKSAVEYHKDDVVQLAPSPA